MFILGLFIGTFFGFFLAACAVVASEGDNADRH